MVLDGLEDAAMEPVPSRLYGNIRPKFNVIRYADYFIVTGDSKELLKNKVKPAIEAFLKTRGLKLSEHKTRLTHIDKGFDFLSQNVRKYKQATDHAFERQPTVCAVQHQPDDP
jgi:RNA-directed DNA polymerase